MKHHRGWGFRGALFVAVSGTFAFAGTGQAQSASGAPGSALRQQLADLAANPTSVSELIATGRAALAMGDGEAALGFFTRADQLAGRDARVKAGLASANVRVGRPETALTLFAEAAALGASEGDLAADRGLAYDLLGQTARAQQDYLASLRSREDGEVRRRLALSLAISGQRDAAMRVIDDQVRQGAPAARRARVMVLALSGDIDGATAAASGSLPPSAAQALTPFLSRLASLSPGDMAAAANLGRAPGGMSRAPSAPIRSAATADPGALAFAGVAPALVGRLPVAGAAAEPAATRRRPGGVTAIARPTPSAALASALPGRPTPDGRGWTAATSNLPRATAAANPEQVAFLQPHPHEPLRRSTAAEAPVELAGAVSPAPRVPPARLAPEDGSRAAAPVQLAAVQPVPQAPAAETPPPSSETPVDGAAANLAVWNGGAPVAATRRAEAAAPRAVEPAHTETSRPGFADVVAAVSSLPAESAAPAATPVRTAAPRRAPAPVRTAAMSATSARPAAATRAAAPRQAHPSRIWVQLGVSANEDAFGYEIGRMRRAAPELLRNQTAHTATIGSSHRLLVGPFPTDAAARTMINGLRAKNIPSLAWTSAAGTQVERLAGAR